MASRLISGRVNMNLFRDIPIRVCVWGDGFLIVNRMLLVAKISGRRLDGLPLD